VTLMLNILLARMLRRGQPRMDLALALTLISLMGASQAVAELPIGLTVDLTLTHDLEFRSYDVLRPASTVGPTPRPLVVDLHGFTSNGDSQRGLSGWNTLAETHGFLVAWPDGLFSSWNGINCCGDAVANNVDDVGFIRAMVAAIGAEVGINPERIYVTGLSNGGAMSHRLACEAADLFAAAAPMAYPIPHVDPAADCNPSESMPVITFMGLTDVLVSYAGAAPTFAHWRDKNTCDSGGDPAEINETYGGSDCVIDTSCGEAGVEVGLCSVRGSDFAPPLDVFNGHILYINDDGFNLSQRAWEFMSAYGTPAEFVVPVLGAPWLLAGALAGAGGMLLERRRRSSARN
jgi:polyhydroxybutyrate depolymerase